MGIERDGKNVCGYSPFTLPEEHPFTSACKIHDWEFDEAEAKNQPKTRKEVDRELLKRMKMIAKARKSTLLYGQAYLYYGLARVFGGLMW